MERGLGAAAEVTSDYVDALSITGTPDEARENSPPSTPRSTT